MRSTCFFALILVLLSGPALSQEPAVTQAPDLVWLEPCPGADSSDVETLKAAIDCLERRSEAMADSQNLLLQNMLLLLEEQFLNEPAKIVERIPAVAHEAELFTSVSAMTNAGFVRPSGWSSVHPDLYVRTFGYFRERSFSSPRRQQTTELAGGLAVPTVVNCVPPLMDKSGFVLIGAELSDWANRQVDGETAMSECLGRDLVFHLTYAGSRSRSEGCYVNRTWFDWYTRRAATEGWPTDDATLCRDEAEEGQD